MEGTLQRPVDHLAAFAEVRPHVRAEGVEHAGLSRAISECHHVPTESRDRLDPSPFQVERRCNAVPAVGEGTREGQTAVEEVTFAAGVVRWLGGQLGRAYCNNVTF